MICDCHLSVDRGIEADSEIPRVSLNCAIYSSRCSFGLGEEAIVDNVSSTSSLWEDGEVSQGRRASRPTIVHMRKACDITVI